MNRKALKVIQSQEEIDTIKRRLNSLVKEVDESLSCTLNLDYDRSSTIFFEIFEANKFRNDALTIADGKVTNLGVCYSRRNTTASLWDFTNLTQYKVSKVRRLVAAYLEQAFLEDTKQFEEAPKTETDNGDIKEYIPTKPELKLEPDFVVDFSTSMDELVDFFEAHGGMRTELYTKRSIVKFLIDIGLEGVVPYVLEGIVRAGENLRLKGEENNDQNETFHRYIWSH